MHDVTHISVGPGEAADPARRPKVVYVDGPSPDKLDQEPFASGRHRVERMPNAGDSKPLATLWSWSEGTG